MSVRIFFLLSSAGKTGFLKTCLQYSIPKALCRVSNGAEYFAPDILHFCCNFIDKNNFWKFFIFSFDFNHSHSSLYGKWCEAQLRLCVKNYCTDFQKTGNKRTTGCFSRCLHNSLLSCFILPYVLRPSKVSVGGFLAYLFSVFHLVKY